MSGFWVIPALSESDLRRYWSKVDKSGGCWSWTGSADRHGRGRFSIGQRDWIAPRVAWAIAHGRNPDETVCHSCDNPNCVNPAHLWLGSQKENMRDAATKGRMSHPREKCANGHPFTPENTYVRRDSNTKQCRVCANIRRDRRRALNAALGRARDLPVGPIKVVDEPTWEEFAAPFRRLAEGWARVEL